MDQNFLRSWINELYKNVPLRIVPYGYTSTFAAMTQGLTITNTLAINSNADFVLTGINYRPNIGAAQNISTKTAAFIRMLIVDTGSGEQFTAQAVDLENYAENGHYEKDMPYPRWISGKTSLSLQATSYAPTAETYAFDLFLHGVLVKQY